MADRFAHPATTPAGGWDAFSASVDSLLQRRPHTPDFDDVNAAKSRLVESIDCGISAVPIYKVTPAPLRHAVFEHALPQHIAAFNDAAPIQTALPIELYKVGESYFVRDGHVRVAHARMRGQLFLRAHVIEYRMGGAICAPGVVQRLLAQERSDFFAQHPFPVGHPAAALDARTLGNWLHLTLHLASVGAAQPHADAENDRAALARWYDAWYRPVARIIRRCHVLADFPAARELDVYLWAVERHGPLTSDQPAHERLRLAQRSVIALWAARRPASPA